MSRDRPPVDTDSLTAALRSRHNPPAPAPAGVGESRFTNPEPGPAQGPSDEVPEEETGPVHTGPVRSVGRAGRGMVNRVLYAPAASMDALDEFADDVFFTTRGRVKRWQVIEAVVRAGLTPGVRTRILRRLAPEMIQPEEGPRP